MCNYGWLRINGFVQVPSMHAIVRIPEGNINNVADNQICGSAILPSVFSSVCVTFYQIKEKNLNSVAEKSNLDL